MRRARWLSIVVVLAVVGAGSSRAQDAKAKPDGQAERRFLERMVGHWDLTGKVYTEDSGAEPMKLDGSVENRFLGDSSWLVGTGKGRAGNNPYETVGITCYDAEKGKFVAAGANSAFPPKLVLEEGTYVESSKTISWKEQEGLEPGSGKKVTVKSEETFKDDNTFVSIAYIKRPGSDQYVKLFEITMTKRTGP